MMILFKVIRAFIVQRSVGVVQSLIRIPRIVRALSARDDVSLSPSTSLVLLRSSGECTQSISVALCSRSPRALCSFYATRCSTHQLPAGGAQYDHHRRAHCQGKDSKVAWCTGGPGGVYGDLKAGMDTRDTVRSMSRTQM
ncbi:hypothetical protein C8Q74DRAFT_135333 [Fomes fomentarius]|nr:hypothetical protein C8Q74DRAFT_135333 [Fomes fomentarius]